MLSSRSVRRLKICAAVGLVLALGLAGAWRWTSLHEFSDPRRVAEWLDTVAGSPWAPAVIVLLYVVANALLFPNTALNFAVIIVLGPFPGLPYALLGSLSAACCAYAVGRHYGPEALRQLHSDNLDRAAAVLRRGRVASIAFLRLVPIAPFSVVNVLAGTARVRLRHFVLGTLLGLLPGNLMVTAFGHQLRTVLRQPSPEHIVVMVGIVIVSLGLLWHMRHLALAGNARK